MLESDLVLNNETIKLWMCLNGVECLADDDEIVNLVAKDVSYHLIEIVDVSLIFYYFFFL